MADPEQPQNNPDTLPPDFFSKPIKVSNPDTLPADFFANASGSGGGDRPSTPERLTGEFGKNHPILAAPVDFLQGVGAGAFSTARRVSQLVHKAIPGIPEVPEDLATPPDSNVAKAGKIAEQAAEFMVPMGAVSKAVKGAPLAVRLGSEALTGGVTSLLQTGGDPRSAAESAATVGALGGLGAAVPAGARAIGLPLFDRIANAAPRPLSQVAIDIAKKYGVPLTRGMEGGSKTVQAVEKILGHTVAPDLYEALTEQGQQGITKGATDLAGNFATDSYAAGDGTVKKLLGAAGKHEQSAQKSYQALEAIEADPANAQTVRVGTKPSAVLDASGKPLMQVVTQDIALPVDMRAAKQQLTPIRDQILKQIPVGQQQYSKGLHAIQQLLDGPDVVPASVADANLSAVKQIQREAIDGKVKFLAGKAIDAVSPSVDDAVAKAGPNAANALKEARQSWKARAQVLDLVDDLSGDVTGKSGQTDAAKKLLKPADSSYPMLQKVLAVAPDSVDDLGKAYLGRVFSKAANGELTNPGEASNIWNQIGPRTKAALYSPDQVKDINAFLQLAKRVNENPNPSGTGVVNSLLKLGILATHPIQGASALTFGRSAARVLYTPEGAAGLRTLLSSPSPVEASKAMTIIKSLAGQGMESEASQPRPGLVSFEK